MDSKEFVESCIRTESKDFDLIRSRFTNRNIRLLHAAMGLCTEAAEFLDVMKKHLFYGKSIDEINLLEELGDSDWYKSIGLDELGKSFEEIWEAVINKLSKRYGIIFNAESAINRNLKQERSRLEEDLIGTTHYAYDSQFSAICKSVLGSITCDLTRITCKDCINLATIHVDKTEAVDVEEVEENVFEVPTKIGKE